MNFSKLKKVSPIFRYKSLQRVHENIHDNVLIHCIFCPFTCVEPSKLSNHHRAHFNIRDYKCDDCEMSFLTRGELNLHFTQKHSGQTTKCEICGSESTIRNVYDHLRHTHKITAIRWDKESRKFNLLDKN